MWLVYLKPTQIAHLKILQFDLLVEESFHVYIIY